MALLNIEQQHTEVPESDEEILARSIREPDAFVHIVRRYEGPFLRKALSILKNEEDAEEVVQEAFSRIYLYAERFSVQEGATFSSWGYRILMNVAFTRYQKLKKERGRTAKLDPEMYEALPDTQMEQFEKMEITDYVISALSGMPEQLARVLTKHFIEGKPHKDIAEEEGISVGAVKTRVHRAKESFRKVLDEKTGAMMI